MMVSEQARRALIVTICVMASAVLSGCRTAREKMQEARTPQNNVFVAADHVPELDLMGDQPAALALWNQTESQSIHILQVARDARLGKRYHANHDLTLQCLAGNAIIELEDERYFVKSPATVVIPRLWAYTIIPHRTEEDFTALLVYSPPFKGDDTDLIKD